MQVILSNGLQAETSCSASLIRLQTSVDQALERQQAKQEIPDTADELTANRNGFGLQHLRKQITGTTLVSQGVMNTSAGLNMSMSDDGSGPILSDDIPDCIGEEGRASDVSARPRELPTRNLGAPDMAETVTAVMKEIQLNRQCRHASRPLMVEPQDPQHRPDDEFRKMFKAQKDTELQNGRHNARDWLRVATWWLLKVRLLRHTLDHSTQLHRL